MGEDGAQLPRLQSGDSLSVQRRLTEIVEKSEISSAATRSSGCTPSTPKSKVQTPKRPWSEGGELVAGKVGLQGLPDGFGQFWRGARGKLLAEDERARARIFHQALGRYVASQSVVRHAGLSLHRAVASTWSQESRSS